MLASLRILVMALLGAVVAIAVAMAIPLGTLDGAFEPTPLLAVPVVGAALALLATQTIGFRHPAIAPGTPRDKAGQQSAAAYSAGTFLRFALSEVVLFISLGLAFVVDRGGYLAVLLAAVLSFALVWWQCWPRDRTIDRSRASLERDGGVSYLRETYGLPTSSVIQEL